MFVARVMIDFKTLRKTNLLEYGPARLDSALPSVHMYQCGLCECYHVIGQREYMLGR